MTNSQHSDAALHLMNQDPSTTDQHIVHKTSATTADLQCNPAPDHPRNPQLTSHPSALKSDTFWTLCNCCSIRYEYPKMYLNQKLLCHHCQQPFMAIEMVAQSASSARPAETGITIQPSGKALKKNVIALGKVDASSDFNAGSPPLKGDKSSIKRGIHGPKGANKGSQGAAGSKSGRRRALAYPKENIGAEQVRSSNNNKPGGSEELSVADICSMLMEKARTEIIRLLNK